MFKGVVVSAVVVVGLAALADRGLAAAAGSATGEAVQRSEGMSDEPDVTFRGFPFVTQAIRGEFTEVDVDARDVRVDDLVFSRVEADLRGVEVSLQDALAGEVEAVPVESGTAVVTLDFADLNSYLDRRPGAPRVSPAADGGLVVRGRVGVARLGTVDVEATATARVTERGIVVTATNVRAVAGAALPAPVATASAARLSFTIPTDRLPFGITVVGVEVQQSGLVLAAQARGVVIRAR